MVECLISVRRDGAIYGEVGIYKIAHVKLIVLLVATKQMWHVQVGFCGTLVGVEKMVKIVQKEVGG